ncbi:hypothetical protein Droror1_Dr00020611, partial [Drosera rotundifolia]
MSRSCYGKVATQLRRAASILSVEHSSPGELLSNSVAHQGQFYGDMMREMSESKSKERSVTADVIEGSEGIDNMGNIHGRVDGMNPSAPDLLLGSHL